MKTLEELRNLSPAELDRLAAEAQVWIVKGTHWLDAGGSWTGYVTNPRGHYDDDSYHPSDSLGLAHCFEAFVIGKVGEAAYLKALFEVAGFDAISNYTGLIRADAQTRVIACLLALPPHQPEEE